MKKKSAVEKVEDKLEIELTPEQRWTRIAEKQLLGRKIVRVRYLTADELEATGWSSKCIVMELDNGALIYPSRDDEGNDAGALFTTDAEHNCIPVI